MPRLQGYRERVEMALTREQILSRYRDAILEGVARTLWVKAFATFIIGLTDDDREAWDVPRHRMPVAESDWDQVAPETPKAAMKAANALVELYEKGQHAAGEGDVVELYGNAQSAWLKDEEEFKHGFSFYEDKGPSEEQRREQQWKLKDAEEFGEMLAVRALGATKYEGRHSRSRGFATPDWLRDKYDTWMTAVRAQVTFQCTFDGEDLEWTGGLQDVREVSHKLGEITIVNQGDESWTSHRYVLSFGGFSQADRDLLLIYANHLEDAIDELIDWVAEEHPDLLANSAVEEEYQRLRAEGQDQQEAMENAEVDTTQGGNAGDYIHSEDWGIVAEDPSDQELNDIAFGKGVRKVNPSRRPRG